MSYFLPHHVHFCAHGDAVVVMDLRKDEYTLLQSRYASALNDVARGDRAALDQLVKRGLLTTDAAAGRAIAPTGNLPPARSLMATETTVDFEIHLRDVYRFFLSCSIAALRLRVYRMEDTVRAVQQRKTLHGSPAPRDWRRAAELVAIFNHLRCYFPRGYRCLLDSLALIEFLARYGVYPSWVFAVQLNPWAAHCWVQADDCAFNEGVEEAMDYIPILVV